MYASHRMKQYHQQAITSASPNELVLKLYELGVSACHTDDRAKLRGVLVELMSSLNHDADEELAGQLHALYEYCLNESAMGDLDTVGEILGGLRDAWRQGVMTRKAA